MFAPVQRGVRPLRMAIDGPTGSGKTYTALRFAFALAGPGGRVAVIDTEHHSASLYAGESPDGIAWQWDECPLEHFAPSSYEQVIQEAGRRGYQVLVIDSLSHAWIGSGGALDQVDRSSSKNNFGAWREVTPQHNAMIEAIMRSPCHVIATLRSKTEYVLEQDERGRNVPRKVGAKPVQRDGVEYEFDIVCDLDIDHRLTVLKTRCSAIDGKIVHKPDAAWFGVIRDWVLTGKPGAAAPRAQGGQAGGIRIDATPPRADELVAGEIKRLCRQLGWTPDRLREVLARVGAQRIGDLSQDQAESLRARLDAKLLEKEGAEAF